MYDNEAMETFRSFILKREEVKRNLERQTLFGDKVVKNYIQELSEDYYRNPALRLILIKVNGENADIGVDSQGRYFHKTYGKHLTQKQAYYISLAVEEAKLASQFSIEECLTEIKAWKIFFSEEFVDRISGQYKESNPEIRIPKQYTDPVFDRGPKYQVPQSGEIFSDYDEKPQVVRDEHSGEWEITNIKPSPADCPLERIADQTTSFQIKENPRLALHVFD